MAEAAASLHPSVPTRERREVSSQGYLTATWNRLRRDRTSMAALVGFAIAGFYRAKFLNASFGGVMVRLHSLTSRVGAFRLMWINVTNLLGILITLGMYYPFAKVRLIRYQLSCMHLEGSGRFSFIEAAEQPDSNALGEEAGDFFNVDLGL